MSIKKDRYSIVKEKSTRYELPHQYDKLGMLYFPVVFGHEYLTRDYFLERQDIDVYMINYVVAGQGFMIYGDKSFFLNPGDTCFLYLGEHNIFYPVTDEMEIYFFHIRGGQIGEFYNAVVTAAGHVLKGYPIEKIDGLYNRIRQNPNNPYAISEWFYSCFVDLLQIALANGQNKYPPLLNKIFRTARSMIPIEELSVQTLSDQLGYNPIYLEQYYKKHTGERLKDYILQIKFDLACDMLLTTSKTVDEIAVQLGYSDCRGLIHLFRKFADCTPLQFRKKPRKK